MLLSGRRLHYEIKCLILILSIKWDMKENLCLSMKNIQILCKYTKAKTQKRTFYFP